MSNLIPYFVLAVVALGFFAVCYAVFSGGDGESKAKEKSYKNISNKIILKSIMMLYLQRSRKRAM